MSVNVIGKGEEKLNNEPINLLWSKDASELTKILTYWEKIKEEWEKKKKEFWKNHNREDFILLLEYFREHREEIEKKYEYLWKMQWIVRKKFEEEYLKEDMLYSWELEKWGDNIVWWCYSYSSFENKWSSLKLKEWAKLDLSCRNIWDDWAEVISQMELKGWVKLGLWWNDIWEDWAEAISKMGLKEWVKIDLSHNDIWDAWAEAILQMELKEWVKLSLFDNLISHEMREKINEWAQSYKDKWIKCEVIVY